MNRYSTVISVLTAVLICLGISIGLSVRNAETLGHQITVVCAEHKTLARLAQEEFAEQEYSTKVVLPRINFPGINHEELVALTVKKEVRQHERAVALGTIAHATC